jgi:hypothetical protein
MIIGTVFIGGVKKFNSQQIQTKFFFLGIPLFPIGDSMLVTGSTGKGRRGIPIKLNGTSVFAGYARIFVLLAALFSIVFDHTRLTMILLGAFDVYLWFFFGRSTEKENEIRTVIARYTNIYAMPEWLENDTLHPLLNQLNKTYESKGRYWITDIKNGDVFDVGLAYTLALLYAEYDPSEENNTLRDKARSLYKYGTVGRPAPVA